MTLKIGIAHHNRELQQALRKCINMHADFSVVWTVGSGPEALRQFENNRPDVVLADINLPVINGVDLTREMMDKSPCQIIIMTENIQNDSAGIFEAMRYGAVDTVEVTAAGTSLSESEKILARKVLKAGILQQSSHIAACREKDQVRHNEPATHNLASTFTKSSCAIKNKKMTHKVLKPPSLPAKPITKSHTPLVIIGSSTGGPQALAQIIAGLPAKVNAAIVIIQHLQQEFSANLANWLGRKGIMNVKLALGEELLEAGTIYVASTNDHMILTPGLRLEYTSEPEDISFRPSVDVFFQSVKENWPETGLAIILTGMGNDGARGLAELRTIGWHTITQDKETSLVYGMPRAAVQMNAAVESLPVEDIADAIIDFIKNLEVKNSNM